MSTSAFFTDGEQVITHLLQLNESTANKKTDDPYTVYEVARCKAWIKKNNYKRVALQFPDELLVDSPSVLSLIEKDTDAKLFILGDTSYGSCCVDEVAAQHYSADCIIHYGRSCLSPTSHLPVLFVFGQQPVDGSHCCEAFRKLFPDSQQKVIVLYDVVYEHVIDIIREDLKKSHPNTSISILPCLEKTVAENEDDAGIRSDISDVEHCGRRFKISGCIDDYHIFYIGGESLTLTNLMMTLNKCTFFTYDPDTRTSRQETRSVNRMLMKRFYMVERAKDAQIVGIVAGTLGVSDYLAQINRLKEITKAAGKKSYTFVMGKLNVAKMANFMEVDVYVLVACPENTLIDSTEFYKPIVTPFEMELACNRAREWTGEYITSFRDLLPGGSSYQEVVNDSDDSDGADVSLITGKIRTLTSKTEDENVTANSTTVMKRDDLLTVANIHGSTAGEFLRGRSWQGLEQKLGETPVTNAVEGTTGIAAGYHHEPKSE